MSKKTERGILYIQAERPAVCLHEDKPSLSLLQGLVGGHIETVGTCLSDDWMHEDGVSPLLIVNDEGKLRGLPLNASATYLMSNRYRAGDRAAGDAVLVGAKGDNFVSLRWDVIEKIKEEWCDDEPARQDKCERLLLPDGERGARAAKPYGVRRGDAREDTVHAQHDGRKGA